MSAGAKHIAFTALLAALAIVLGYFERLIPIAPAIPGIKLGLGNAVVLFALYALNARSALCVSALKVLLTGLLFSSAAGFIYSAAGAALSFAVMLPLHRLKGLSMVGVSIAGACCHVLGQLTAAVFLVGAAAAFACAPVLLAASVVTGALTGFIAQLTLSALKKGGYVNATQAK
ncbi:MAG: Gx transporter family protein [Clostridia bacterium]|nr:Gx transporter family protein [Clostridia bacterium]